jgi:hypothetical protein
MKCEMRNYTAETFRPYTEHVFVFQPQSVAGVSPDPVHLRLTEVKTVKSGASPMGFREPFSLLFVPESGEPPSSGVHRLLHADFESCEWLLSRVVIPGRDVRVPYFEAVFG